MTLERVDFYVLNRSLPDGKLRAACRIAKKALEQGYTIYVQTPDPEEAARLDDMMWTFDQGSFLPHRRVDRGDDPAPIIIGCEPPQGEPPDLLLASGTALPERPQIYRRIAEIVDNTEGDKRAGRRRYKEYQNRGYRVETHHISP